MGKSEVFLCPFCGAPYREPIHPGTSIVKCGYCGISMLVPPSYGGTSEPCSNHPGELAVGFCYNCGRSLCKSCLHIVETVDKGSGRAIKSVICPRCIQEREAEKAREKIQKKIVLASIALIVIIFGAFIVYGIYTHSVPIGSARRNWAALGSVSAGVHVMITPIDPREMRETNLSRYFTDHGTSNDFVSLVVCGENLADFAYGGTTFQPYMKRIEVKVTFYTCSFSRHMPGYTANAFYTPHTETVAIFIGKLAPGTYEVTFKIYNGGAIATYCHGDIVWSCDRVTEPGTGGGTETTTTYLRIV